LFVGSHSHALDEKGRTMVPSSFRAELDMLNERSLIITYHPVMQPAIRLVVWPASRFRAHVEAFNQELPTPHNAAARDYYRGVVIGEADQIDIDKPGRILIPASKRKHLALGDKLVFVGDGSETFQIWRPEDREALFAFGREQPEAVREHLSRWL